MTEKHVYNRSRTTTVVTNALAGNAAINQAILQVIGELKATVKSNSPPSPISPPSYSRTMDEYADYRDFKAFAQSQEWTYATSSSNSLPSSNMRA